jgi:hypothetical protein
VQSPTLPKKSGKYSVNFGEHKKISRKCWAFSRNHLGENKAADFRQSHTNLCPQKLRRIPDTAVSGKNSNSEIRQDMCLANFSSQPANVRPTGVRCRRLQLIRETACSFER